eukprot:08771_4
MKKEVKGVIYCSLVRCIRDARIGWGISHSPIHTHNTLNKGSDYHSHISRLCSWERPKLTFLYENIKLGLKEAFTP